MSFWTAVNIAKDVGLDQIPMHVYFKGKAVSDHKIEEH